MMRTAIFAARGALPAAIAAQLSERPLVAVAEGFEPEGLTADMIFRVERLVPFLNGLRDAGVGRVVFAGAMERPRLDPAMFDAATATMVPRLLAALQGGDDATLRVVIDIFEEFGFVIAGVDEVAPTLVPAAGAWGCGRTATDETDAARAVEIVAALGAVDVGQGAVVQQGLCLAVETLGGTDAMLASLATIAPLRPDAAKGRGLFYKAPKSGQDRRIDLPTIGPATVGAAASAGLGGIAWEAGGVICLDLPGMQAMAAERGLFLWARQP